MAGRQSEPSIDEILSSIRKVIAEDDSIRTAPMKAPQKNVSAKNINEDILELTAEDSSVNNNNSSVEPLVNQETAQGLRQGLSTLAALSEPSAPPQFVRSGETSMEGLVSDMLRPMMKEWLDQNLPTLVESMVEREIQRITKKG